MRVDVLLRLLNKTVNDPDFRAAAAEDARAASLRAGFMLTEEEMAAFADFHAKAVEASLSLSGR